MKIPDTTAADLLAQSFGTIAELIGLQAAQRPQHPALVQDGITVTYRSLDAIMDRVAASLQRDGVMPGESIAICAANSIEYAVLFLGSLRAGVAVAPLAPSTAAEGLAVMLEDCGARMLFLDEMADAALAPAGSRIDIGRVSLDGVAGGKAFDAWLAGPHIPPIPVDVRPDSPFNIIYSSGTTGAPKGIVQPHSMRWGQVQRGVMNGYGTDAVTLLSTPLYSNTTLVSFFATVALGGTTVLMKKFDAASYLALAEKHRVTHTMLVPVQYQRLLAMPDFGRYDLSSFRAKFCTSAPFSAALKKEVLGRWPGGLTEFYGMTEGGGSCVLAAHEFPDKLHTVGRPAPGSEFRLVDEEGREVSAGETGEIVGRSGSMMTGYHKQPGKTAEAEWHDAEGRRFIRTGDVGRFDADGFLVLMDRKKDMIISGGFNIYPSDLEAVLLGHPDLEDASVVGVPSERWGETPVAFVVARAGVTLDAPAVLAWANERLGKMQRLAAVEVVESLPRSAIGKVLKRELRDRYSNLAGQAA
ncbi:class I adenylate-forming enzyme family protein [Noviherbaspirillum galbum]|uniref:Acyl--CoA ligase n=1 Tax=Noviherbaspirillum galbum TaxID=2709383 RepID=A0A6B3SWF4_9BURK|nr:class I adenylate-forming enzyme family protein [Noviherbaspirillum galbum]NEX64841.1 acyl--CoA ligase [Noviherbaspirillum galbum]